MSSEPIEPQGYQVPKEEHRVTEIGDIQVYEMQRVFNAFDKVATEIPQLFALIQQGISISLEPLRDSLEALKIKVDALVEQSQNTTKEKEDNDD